MGMGEPLLNLDNVLKAINIMFSDLAYGLSKYRVTVSTSGIVPKMRELKNKSEASLAVSLHAASDSLRDQLMPINQKYKIAEILEVCRDYYENPRRCVTFEYVLLKNVNDSIEDAQKLVKLLRDIPCKINLIPYNPVKTNDFAEPDKDSILAFQKILSDNGFNTIVRTRRGDGIKAACGQLVAEG